MSPGTIALAGAALLVAGGAAMPEAAARHIGISNADRFVLCAAQALGKPVLIDSVLAQTTELDGMPCPVNRTAFDRSLAARNILAKDGGEGWLLVPSRFFEWPPPGTLGTPLVSWTDVRVVFETKPNPAMKSRELTAAERSEIRRVVLTAGRTAPVSSRVDSDPQGRATIPYTILIGIVATTERPMSEAVVVIAGLENYHQRMAFGHLTAGHFTLEWDSPVFNGRHLLFDLSDLDGDGSPEILLDAEEGVKLPLRSLVAFSQSGQELTRQEPCDRGATAEYRAGATCPLFGSTIQIVEAAGRRAKDIVAIRDDDPVFSGRRVYRLINGRYRERRR